MKTDLSITTLGAAQTARHIAQGDFSAAQALDATLAAAEQHHGCINALVARRFEAARAEALAVDQARVRGEPLGPLAGVPSSIKDVLDVQGLPSTGGLPHRAGHRATQDAPAVARLREAGAVVLGKTNVAQLLIYLETDNPLHGRSNHPQDPERSCGGSSGGEAALVATGGSALSLGTDIGGSVRVPAAFCGIAGLKPTAGLVPDPQRLSIPTGALAIGSQIGPMARRVEDLALALDVLAPQRPRMADAQGVRGLRVGVYEDDGLFAPSPSVRQAACTAAQALRAAGATVVPWRIPDPGEVQALFFGLLTADGGDHMRRLLGGDKADPRVAQLLLAGRLPHGLRRLLAGIAGMAGQTHLPRLLRAMDRRDAGGYWDLCERQIDYRARFVAAMDGSDAGPLDLLLGPVMPLPAFRHGATQDLGMPGVYTTVYNVTGFPAGSVPCGRVAPGQESDRPASRDLAERAARRTEDGSAGLPLAVQVGGRPGQEDRVLAAMRAIEAAL